MRKAFVWGLVLCSVLPAAAARQDQLRNARRIIDDADLTCSLLAVEEIPRLRIKSAERMEERAFLVQGDLFVFDRVPGDGLIAGQMLMILEIGETVKVTPRRARPVTAVYQRGRAKIVILDAKSGRAQVEKACGPIEIGQALGPFAEREVLKGFDQGFASVEWKTEGPQGAVLYLGKGVRQAGPGQMVLVELGTDQGIQAGQQLTVFRVNEKNSLWQGMANVIVVNAGPRVSAVKILSARDSLELGDRIQVK
jgi:hypothetical protein